MTLPAKYLRNVAQDPRVTPDVLDAVRQVESGGNPKAVGPLTRFGSSAKGGYQLMDATAKDLGVDDPFDPVQSRKGASTYLNWLIGQTGNLEDAISANNVGLGAFKKLGKRNLPRETVDYTKKVMALLAKHEKGVQVSVAAAPVNQQDPSPKEELLEAPAIEEEKPLPAAEDEEVPTQLASGPSPTFTKPAKIGNPPSQFMGKNNPIAMVDALLRDPMSLSRGETQNMAGGGEVLKAPPQNKVLGALSALLKGVDDRTRSFRDLKSEDVPTLLRGHLLAGQLLTPSFESMSNTVEDSSYGMPLTTGKGMTTGLRPDVGFAALEASQLLGAPRAASAAGKGLKNALPGVVSKLRAKPDVVEAMFGSPREWKRAKGDWDATLQKTFSPDPGIPMKKGGPVQHRMGGKCKCLGCTKERFYK